MLDMSASPQMVQLAMLETIRVLRGEVDQVDMVDQPQIENGAQEESGSDEEEEEDMTALYQRMNISRRMSLPANLPLLKHDDSQRRLQRLERARGNFKEDDSQEEEEEGAAGESLMAASPQPMTMYSGSPASYSDVGRLRRRGGRTVPDVLLDGSRSSSGNPLPDLLLPQAPMPAALECPDSCSVLYHQQPTYNYDTGPPAQSLEKGWLGIAQGLNRLATVDKGIQGQRRKSCVGSKLAPIEVPLPSTSSKKKIRRRRSVAGTEWLENRRELTSSPGGIFRDICAIVSIFGFYVCVRKIESLLK